MPVTLSKIANNTATVKIAVDSDAVSVTYYPGRVTEKTFARLQAFASIDEDSVSEKFADFNEMLSALIKSWDLYEDDEETVVFPIVPDRLAELPLMFRASVIQAILADIRPEAMAPQNSAS